MGADHPRVVALRGKGPCLLLGAVMAHLCTPRLIIQLYGNAIAWGLRRTAGRVTGK
jgi:hypothetical protein